MNPFEMKPKKVDDCVLSWSDLAARPYKKQEVDPYTKTRIILLNGAEYEGVWFSHRFSRRETNNDVRRSLAVVRRQEQQQQKLLSSLKPVNETQLETTISYEQLAVDLTSLFAQRTKDKNFKQTLDFALLEDFDHLYRYADLLLNDTGIFPTFSKWSRAKWVKSLWVDTRRLCPVVRLSRITDIRQTR